MYNSNWTKGGHKNEMLGKTYPSCNCGTCTNYSYAIDSTMGEYLYQQPRYVLLQWIPKWGG